MKVTVLIPNEEHVKFAPEAADSLVGKQAIITAPGKGPVYVAVTKALVTSEGMQVTYEVPDEYAEVFAMKNGYSIEGAEQ